MSSKQHIPSIIRPHFLTVDDEEHTDGSESHRKRNGTKSANEYGGFEHLPKVKKDNAHVSFAPTVQAPPLVFEKSKTVVDPKLNVDHHHYEQWARNPNRKAPSTALLRGIQQLKAKMTRDKDISEENGQQYTSEPYRVPNFSGMLREKSNVSLTSNPVPLTFPSAVKQKQPSAEVLQENINRSLSSLRNILKPSQQVFDGVGIKRSSKREAYDLMSEEMQRLNKKIEATTSLDQIDSARDTTTTAPVKPRTGLAKIHDRNPFPVSVNQPVCVGDHVFLLNEPFTFKTPETWRLKSRGSAASSKPADRNSTSGVPNSASVSQHLKPSFPFDNQGDSEHKENAAHAQRQGTYFGSFLPKKSNRRIPALISSAELYDFSQLAESRTIHEINVLERTRTETSIYLKGPKLTKFIPRSQRLSALLK